MTVQTKISKMTGTPEQREMLENLSSEDKLQLILSLTDSSNFIDLLGFIKSAHNDADWCQSYR